MKGVIRTKEVCSVCQESFVEIKKLGYICPTHKTTPKRFFVDLFYKGQRLKIYSDKQGQPLDTYQRASSLLAHINYEIKNHLFDPSHCTAPHVAPPHASISFHGDRKFVIETTFARTAPPLTRFQCRHTHWHGLAFWIKVITRLCHGTQLEYIIFYIIKILQAYLIVLCGTLFPRGKRF